MENNNNGRGVFYGVIGIATLVVAVIGATFAYFTATAGNNEAIQVGTTTVTLQLVDEKRNFRTDMIPVDSTNQYFNLYPGLMSEEEDGVDATGKGTCTDDDGNAICGIYEFTIKNPSPTVAQTVYGSLTVTDTGFTNMKYAVFKGDSDTIEESAGKFNVSASENKKVTEAAVGETVIAKKAFLGADVEDDWGTWTEQTLAPGESQTYTILVWLEEAGEGNASEQGKTMTAAIKFDTAGGGSGITGNLSAAS